MINDGGAERMVRNRKTEWWQILAIVIMLIFVAAVFLFFFFIENGERMVTALNKATVGDAYDILTTVKEKYPQVAVTEYENKDGKVYIAFKYYGDMIDDDTDLQALSYEVKGFMEEYLEAHPDDFINKGGLLTTLRFPEVVYRNYREGGEKEETFEYVSYLQSEMSAGDFLGKIGFLKKAKTLTFEAGGSRLYFAKDADFSGVFEIKGLESLTIEKSDLDDEKIKSIREECDKRGIECRIETGE